MSHYKRPSLPYNNERNQFDTRFRDNAALKKPLSGESLDAELNYLIDSMNANYQLIIGTAAGIIPGSSFLDNANKFPTTNGQGTISWTLVKTNHIDASSITNDKVHDIGGEKLINESVTTEKLSDNAVTTAKLSNQSVSKDKLVSQNQNETVLLISQKNGSTFAEFPMAAGKVPYIMRGDQTGAVANKTLSEIFNDLQTYTYDGVWLKNDSVITTRIKNSSVYGHVMVGGTSQQGQGMTTLRLLAHQIPKGSANGLEVEATDIAGLWASARDNTLSGSKLSDETITRVKVEPVARSMIPIGVLGGYATSVQLNYNVCTVTDALGFFNNNIQEFIMVTIPYQMYFQVTLIHDIPGNIRFPGNFNIVGKQIRFFSANAYGMLGFNKTYSCSLFAFQT